LCKLALKTLHTKGCPGFGQPFLFNQTCIGSLLRKGNDSFFNDNISSGEQEKTHYQTVIPLKETSAAIMIFADNDYLCSCYNFVLYQKQEFDNP